MLYGLDGPTVLLLPVLWSVASARSSQLTFRRTPAAIAGTARTALVLIAVSLAVTAVFVAEAVADLGWFLARDKTGLHLALTVLPAVAAAVGALPRLARLRRQALGTDESAKTGLRAAAGDPVLAVPPKVAAYAAGVNLYFAFVPHEQVGLRELAAPFGLLTVLVGVAIIVQRRRRGAASTDTGLAARRPGAARVLRIATGAGLALIILAVLGVTAMTTSTTTGYVADGVAQAQELVKRTPVRTGTVTVDGDDLYYEVRGSGPPLLMIPGAGGDAGFYAYPAALLANEFQVITYDRRGNSRSTHRHPGRLDMTQQAADAVAVIRATGHRSALVFGNSGGAIIALELARAFPDAVTGVVAHEPPMMTVSPDRQKWLALFRATTGPISRIAGEETGMLVFALTVGIPFDSYASIPDDFSARMGANHAFFVKNEMYPFVAYEPDMALLRAGGIPIVLAVGTTTLATNRYYGQPAGILAERLGSRTVTMPGHHNSYFDLPGPWTEALRAMLRDIQLQRRS
ncbi:alpha/beta hydrolase [Nonomuraea sp. NPDC048916]|uniref:alpha/beta fold hydrolase n=1 Tax=Nonomuraea sp. NPDC048916 TaxID=3154232 RepID=UPI0033FD43E0